MKLYFPFFLFLIPLFAISQPPMYDYFEGTFPFPQSYTDIRTSGGNNTFLLDEYKWEFY